MSNDRSRRNSAVFVSKLLSLMLRHRPDEFGVEVDEQGYADLDAVVEALQDRDGDITLDDVESVVYDGEKRRFEIEEGRIRARYGHSIPVDLGTDPVEPPEFLYKGVEPKAVNAVLREGLEPGDRQYVHLSFEADVARDLGSGRRRKPSVVIRVNALAAHKAGIPFYDCGPTILTPQVPADYVTVDESSEGWEEAGREERPATGGGLPGPVGSGAEEAAPPQPSSPSYGRRRRFSGRR